MGQSTQATGSGADQLRRHYQDDVAAVERELVELGAGVRGALSEAAEALTFGDRRAAAAVIAGDESIDRRFRDVEGAVSKLLTRAAPTPTQKRLLSAAVHVAIHLERIGDMAVNLATLTTATAHLSADPATSDIRPTRSGSAGTPPPDD